MRYVLIEICTSSGNTYGNINVVVPDDFYEWTEDSQLKYLFNMSSLIDHNKKTIYNGNCIERIQIQDE